MQELKIGTSSVRGVVGDALTPELIMNFASAFGTWANGRPVVIGRDPRRSSLMLRAAVVAGLLAEGCEVIDLGITPTPVVSFGVRELGASGGLSITGSHNDSRWNALKFIGSDGALLNAVKSEELLDIYHAKAFRRSRVTETCRDSEAHIVRERYFEHLLSALDAEAIRTRRFKVAVDFCNGSCHAVMSEFLRRLDCRLLPLNASAANDFAHPPSPSVANMQQLREFVLPQEVDLGAALNVDGDRIAFVTADGEALSEEYTLPLAAQNRLTRRPGCVVTNLSTSRMIDSLAEQYQQRVVRAAVGEGYVIDRGLEEGAVLVGEGNGGIGALPTTMTFDAMLTLGMVLESIAVADLSPGAIVEQLPRFFMFKGELPCPPDQVYQVLQRYRSRYSESELMLADGVRLEWEDAWMHVRASNTEPLLRVIVEAETEDRGSALFREALSLGRSLIGARGEV